MENMWISTSEHKDLQNQNEDLIAPSAILENKLWGSHQQTNAEGGKKHGSQMSINPRENMFGPHQEKHGSSSHDWDNILA